MCNWDDEDDDNCYNDLQHSVAYLSGRNAELRKELDLQKQRADSLQSLLTTLLPAAREAYKIERMSACDNATRYALSQGRREADEGDIQNWLSSRGRQLKVALTKIDNSPYMQKRR